MSRPTFRGRIDERLRLMQIYEVFLRYGSDAAFDRGFAGDVRRGLQGWLYGLDVAPLAAPEKVRLLLQELGPTYVKLGQIVSSRAEPCRPSGSPSWHGCGATSDHSRPSRRAR
jgi:ubiquinone biosynthesis protein